MPGCRNGIGRRDERIRQKWNRQKRIRQREEIWISVRQVFISFLISCIFIWNLK